MRLNPSSAAAPAKLKIPIPMVVAVTPFGAASRSAEMLWGNIKQTGGPEKMPLITFTT